VAKRRCREDRAIDVEWIGMVTKAFEREREYVNVSRLCCEFQQIARRDALRRRNRCAPRAARSAKTG
jgi:hypothetical protein